MKINNSKKYNLKRVAAILPKPLLADAALINDKT